MTNKLPSVLKTPPMLVKNAQVPKGQVTFQVLGDNDKTVFTVVVPETTKPFDLTHYAPLHNLFMSSALKKLLDTGVLVLLNKAEIDEWMKDKCPTDGGGGNCPTPELKDQKPLTFDAIGADATAITGKGEPSAIIAIKVGTDSYYGVVTGAGTFSISAQNLAAGTYSAKATKQGYKDTTGSLVISALQTAADVVVDPFIVRDPILGNAQPNARIIVKSHDTTAETVADADGDFSLPSAGFYTEDKNPEITVTAILAGHETKKATVKADRLPAPQITLVKPITFGQSTVVIETAPNARVKIGNEVRTADTQGKASWTELPYIQANIRVDIGLDADSIYMAGSETFTPNKRKIVMIATPVKQADTEVVVRIFGSESGVGIALPKGVLKIGAEEHEAQQEGDNITYTGLDLTGVTSVTATIKDRFYEADDLEITVSTGEAELKDQAALTVENVLEDAKLVKGTGEPEALVNFTQNNVTYYTRIDSQGKWQVDVKDLAEGKVIITAVKTGYRDATVDLTISGLTASDPLTAEPFQVRGTIQGKAQAGAKITLMAQGKVFDAGIADASGDWSYSTATMYERDQNFDINVLAELATYETKAITVRGTKISAPLIELAAVVYFGDKSVAVKSAPYAKVKHGIYTTESRPDGLVLFLENSPIQTDLVFEIGLDVDSIYETSSKTFTPTKWETYLVPNQAKQTDTEITVRVLSLTTGLPLPKGELSFNGDKFEATADVNGILTFTGLDLTDKTQANVKLISDLYVAAPIVVRVLTEEEAGNKKTQKPLTANQIFADETTLSGQGEPNAILEIGIQGRTYYVRIGADGLWTVLLGADYTDPMTYTIHAYKQGYHDADGQLKVNALAVLDTLIINDFDLGEPVTGTAEPDAILTLNVVGYPDSNSRSVQAGSDGTWTHATSSLYSKDQTGALVVVQKGVHAVPQTVQKLPRVKRTFTNITLDRPVTYGDHYFILQAEPNALVTYGAETKICDADGQVLFRPVLLTDVIRATIGNGNDSIYVPYTAALTPNQIVAYFTTQTILSTHTSITFNVYGTRNLGAEYTAVLSGTGVSAEKKFNGDVVTFDQLDLTQADHVTVKMNDPKYSNVEYRFVVTKGTFVPPDEDQAPLTVTGQQYLDTTTVTGSAEPNALVGINDKYFAYANAQGVWEITNVKLALPKFVVTSRLQGYKDKTVDAVVHALQKQPASISFAPYYAFDPLVLTGLLADANVRLTNATGGQSITVKSDLAGSATVQTLDLFFEDSSREILVTVTKPTYETKTYSAPAIPKPNPQLLVSPAPRFNDTAIGIISEPFANLVLKMDGEPDLAVRCGIKGYRVIDIGHRIQTLGTVTIEASDVGFYESKTVSINPVKESLYFSPDTVQETAPNIVVSAHGTIDGFTDTFDIVLTVDAEAPISKPYSGTSVSFDVDLKGKAKFKLSLEQHGVEVYQHAGQTFNIVKEVIPELEDQIEIVLTTPEFHEDLTTLEGFAEPEALLFLGGTAVVVRPDGSWTMPITVPLEAGTEYVLIARKPDYKDATHSFYAQALTPQDELVVNPFTVGSPITGKGESGALLQVGGNLGKVYSIELDGTWTIENSFDLVSGDMLEPITFETIKPHTATQRVVVTPSRKVAKVLASTQSVYGEKTIGFKLEPYAKISVKVGTQPALDAVCASDGSILLPVGLIDAPIVVSYGAAADSLYQGGQQTITPRPMKAYFTMRWITGRDVVLATQIHGLNPEIPVAKATMTYDSTVIEADVNADGTANFSGFDVAGVAFITLNFSHQCYTSPDQQFPVLLDESIVDKVQKPLTVKTPDAYYVDSTQIAGNGEPNAIIIFQNVATQSDAQGDWTIPLPVESNIAAVTPYTIRSVKSGYIEATATVNFKALEQQAPLVVDQPIIWNKPITGTGEPDATIIVGAGMLVPTKVGTDGKWSVEIDYLLMGKVSQISFMSTKEHKEPVSVSYEPSEMVPDVSSLEAHPVTFGDKFLQIKTSDSCLVTVYSDAERTTIIERGAATREGYVTFTLDSPISSTIWLDVGDDSNESVYKKTSAEIFPAKIDMGLLVPTMSTERPDVLVRLLGLRTGLAKPTIKIVDQGGAVLFDGAVSANDSVSFTLLPTTKTITITSVSEFYRLPVEYTYTVFGKEVPPERDSDDISLERAWVDSQYITGTLNKNYPETVVTIVSLNDVAIDPIVARADAQGRFRIPNLVAYANPNGNILKVRTTSYNTKIGVAELVLENMKVFADPAIKDFRSYENLEITLAQPALVQVFEKTRPLDVRTVVDGRSSTGTYTGIYDTGLMDFLELTKQKYVVRLTAPHFITREIEVQADLRSLPFTRDTDLLTGTQYVVFRTYPNIKGTLSTRGTTYQATADFDGKLLFNVSQGVEQRFTVTANSTGVTNDNFASVNTSYDAKPRPVAVSTSVDWQPEQKSLIVKGKIYADNINVAEYSECTVQLSKTDSFVAGADTLDGYPTSVGDFSFNLSHTETWGTTKTVYIRVVSTQFVPITVSTALPGPANPIKEFTSGITVNPVYVDDAYITGKAPVVSDTETWVYIGGGVGTFTLSDGTFTLPAANLIGDLDIVLYAVATGYKTISTTTKVIALAALPNDKQAKIKTFQALGTIYGTAPSGAEVVVSYLNTSTKVIANAQGNWEVDSKPFYQAADMRNVELTLTTKVPRYLVHTQKIRGTLLPISVLTTADLHAGSTSMVVEVDAYAPIKVLLPNDRSSSSISDINGKAILPLIDHEVYGKVTLVAGGDTSIFTELRTEVTCLLNKIALVPETPTKFAANLKGLVTGYVPITTFTPSISAVLYAGDDVLETVTGAVGTEGAFVLNPTKLEEATRVKYSVVQNNWFESPDISLEVLEEENPDKPVVPVPAISDIYVDSVEITGTTLPNADVTAHLARDVHVKAGADGKFKITNVYMPEGMSEFHLSVGHSDYKETTFTLQIKALLASAELTCKTEDVMLGKFSGTAEPNSVVNVRASGHTGYEYDHDVSVGADGKWNITKNEPFENGVLHITSTKQHYVTKNLDHTIILYANNIVTIDKPVVWGDRLFKGVTSLDNTRVAVTVGSDRGTILSNNMGLFTYAFGKRVASMVLDIKTDRSGASDTTKTYPVEKFNLNSVLRSPVYSYKTDTGSVRIFTRLTDTLPAVSKSGAAGASRPLAFRLFLDDTPIAPERTLDITEGLIDLDFSSGIAGAEFNFIEFYVRDAQAADSPFAESVSRLSVTMAGWKNLKDNPKYPDVSTVDGSGIYRVSGMLDGASIHITTDANVSVCGGTAGADGILTMSSFYIRELGMSGNLLYTVYKDGYKSQYGTVTVKPKKRLTPADVVYDSTDWTNIEKYFEISAPLGSSVMLSTVKEETTAVIWRADIPATLYFNEGILANRASIRVKHPEYAEYVVDVSIKATNALVRRTEKEAYFGDPEIELDLTPNAHYALRNGVVFVAPASPDGTDTVRCTVPYVTTGADFIAGKKVNGFTAVGTSLTGIKKRTLKYAGAKAAVAGSDIWLTWTGTSKRGLNNATMNIISPYVANSRRLLVEDSICSGDAFSINVTAQELVPDTYRIICSSTQYDFEEVPEFQVVKATLSGTKTLPKELNKNLTFFSSLETAESVGKTSFRTNIADLQLHMEDGTVLNTVVRNGVRAFEFVAPRGMTPFKEMTAVLRADGYKDETIKVFFLEDPSLGEMFKSYNGFTYASRQATFVPKEGRKFACLISLPSIYGALNFNSDGTGSSLPATTLTVRRGFGGGVYMTAKYQSAPSWVDSPYLTVTDFPLKYPLPVSTTAPEWGTKENYVKPDNVLVVYMPIALNNMPVYVKYSAGYGFTLTQAYWNGGAANSKGLYTYTLKFVSGNYANNGVVGGQHTRFVIPITEFATNTNNLEQDLMP